MQSSLQSFPVEIREPVVRSLKTWADFALGGSLVDIFNVARRFGLMVLTFATCNLGIDVVCTMCDQCGRAPG